MDVKRCDIRAGADDRVTPKALLSFSHEVNMKVSIVFLNLAETAKG